MSVANARSSATTTSLKLGSALRSPPAGSSFLGCTCKKDVCGLVNYIFLIFNFPDRDSGPAQMSRTQAPRSLMKRVERRRLSADRRRDAGGSGAGPVPSADRRRFADSLASPLRHHGLALADSASRSLVHYEMETLNDLARTSRDVTDCAYKSPGGVFSCLSALRRRPRLSPLLGFRFCFAACVCIIVCRR